MLGDPGDYRVPVRGEQEGQSVRETGRRYRWGGRGGRGHKPRNAGSFWKVEKAPPGPPEGTSPANTSIFSLEDTLGLATSGAVRYKPMSFDAPKFVGMC